MSEHKPFIKPEVVSWEMAAVLRGRSPADRVEMLRGMWRMARRLAEAGVRRQHPDWGDSEVAQEVARRIARGSD